MKQTSSIALGAILVAAFATVQPSLAAASGGGYAGSQKCRTCHAHEYESWRESLHSRMMRTLEEDKEVGVTDLGRLQPPFRLQNAAFVLGNMNTLLFLKADSGSLRLLPYQYDLRRGSWDELSVGSWVVEPERVEGEAESSKEDWGALCAGCHTTGYDPSTGRFSETSISCESCHGPGARHVETTSVSDIVNPLELEGERGSQICAQCHSRGRDRSGKHPYPVGFRPGEELLEHFELETSTPGKNTTLFWGNSVARVHHAQYNEFVGSKHFRNGVRCYDCHSVHRVRGFPASPNTRVIALTERHLLRKRADSVCVTCHAQRDSAFRLEGAAADASIVDTHISHPAIVAPGAAGKPGAATASDRRYEMHCWDCHMPQVETEPPTYAVRSHTFAVPDPAYSAASGAPDACAQCHSAEPPEHLAEAITVWHTSRATE